MTDADGQSGDPTTTAEGSGRSDRPTRRAYVAYGSLLVGGGLLAGCLGDGDGDGDSPTATATDERTDADQATAEEASTATGSDEGEPYSVSMAPMGEVTFETVPETIFTRLTHLAGMAFALGRGDDVNAMHAPDYYDALWNQYTPRLPGVSLDWSGLYSSWEPTTEKLYDLDSDVHLADPASVAALDGWDRAAVADIGENVGPWFGNSYSDSNRKPPEPWAADYEYYGLWEMFERVAGVFRAEERYEALAAVHDDLLATIRDGLPPEAERPTAAMALLSDIEDIYVYRVNAPGFWMAHTRPCGAREALGDSVSSGDNVDLEVLLDADPDVLFAFGGMHPGTDVSRIRQNLQDHPVGRQLSAVQADRVLAQGGRYQGPILNLFQLEMTAKQLYPEQFGEWPTYEEGPYPEFAADEQLFDREQVASAIRGEV